MTYLITVLFSLSYYEFVFLKMSFIFIMKRDECSLYIKIILIKSEIIVYTNFSFEL